MLGQRDLYSYPLSRSGGKKEKKKDDKEKKKKDKDEKKKKKSTKPSSSSLVPVPSGRVSLRDLLRQSDRSPSAIPLDTFRVRSVLTEDDSDEENLNLLSNFSLIPPSDSSCKTCKSAKERQSALIPSGRFQGSVKRSPFVDNSDDEAEVINVVRKDTACWDKPGQVTWTFDHDHDRPDMTWPDEYWRDLPKCPDELVAGRQVLSREDLEDRIYQWESFSGCFNVHGLGTLLQRLEPVGALSMLQRILWPGCLVLALPVFATVRQNRILSCGWVLVRCLCFSSTDGTSLSARDVLTQLSLYYNQPFTQLQLAEIKDKNVQGQDPEQVETLLNAPFEGLKNEEILRQELENGVLMRHQTLPNCCFTGFRVLNGPEGEYVLQLCIKPRPANAREQFCVCQSIPPHSQSSLR